MKKRNITKTLFIVISFSSILFSCRKEEKNIEEIIKPDPYITELVQDINADTIKKNVQWLENMGTRFTLSNDRKQVALRIKERFIKYGYSNTILDSFFIMTTYKSILYSTWQYNVVSTIEGTELPDSISIIGAHYDSILKVGDAFSKAPGANDNASGVAAALEVARVLYKHQFKPKSTIKFIAFGAEELGLFGSYNYANNSFSSQKKIKMMLNNDMIAYWPINQNNMRVNIIDYSNSIDLRLKAEKACQLYTALEYNNDNKFQAYSDSYPFYLNGYKAIFFITDANDPNYHTTNDLVLNCNFDFCREVAKISCAMLVENNN